MNLIPNFIRVYLNKMNIKLQISFNYFETLFMNILLLLLPTTNITSSGKVK